MGAFKIRGAFTAASRLPAAERARGLVTSSSGNHGLAIAYAGRHFGVRAVIVMPESAPRIKIDGVQKMGGEVVLAGKIRSPEQMERAQQLARDEGLVLIPPYDHPDVVEGQGTVGLEIAEDWPEVTDVLAPVSGGGLLAGTCLGVHAARPEARIWAVEPAGAAKLSAALAAGRPTTIPHVDTICDGLRTPTIGELTFPVIRTQIAGVAQVTDAEIVAAMKALQQELGFVIEPSGAVTVAALLARKIRPDGPTAAILSGGNVDAETFARLVAA
ncbi:MAG: threonine/serine dehydratase [Gemmatimonadetes bacterium]|nr:threonine/serine dehydratase [Gemmatimonadota bacterium]